MKNTKINFITALLLLTSTSIAQTSFELSIENSNDEVLADVAEGPNNELVFVGRSYFPNVEAEPDGIILRVDSLGEIINTVMIDSLDYCILHNIHFYNNHYYVLGAIRQNQETEYKLSYYKYDTDLNLIDYTYSNLPDGRYFGYMNSIIDSDENLVLCGYTNAPPDSTSEYPAQIDGYFYKLNLEGDSLNSHYFYTPDIWSKLPIGIIENLDNTKYYICIREIDEVYNSSLLEMSKDFTLLDTADFFTSGNPVPDTLAHSYFGNPVRLNNDSILISGVHNRYPNDFIFTIINETGEILKYRYFITDNYSKPAEYYTASKKGNKVFVGYTSNMNPPNAYYSTDTSHLQILKIDNSLNTIWRTTLGGDAYYLLHRVLATSDGGCVVTAYKYISDNNPEHVRNIYIVKLNSMGEIQWTENLISDQSISIYPNPVQNRLHFDIASNAQIKSVTIFNHNGQIIMKENSNTDINTSQLNPGMYILQIKTTEGVIAKKFIKS